MRESIVERSMMGVISSENVPENSEQLTLEPANCGSLSGECSPHANDFDNEASDWSDDVSSQDEYPDDKKHANGTLVCNTRL